jgi:hypothetical protein
MNMKNTPTALRLRQRSRSLSRSATVGVIWGPYGFGENPYGGPVVVLSSTGLNTEGPTVQWSKTYGSNLLRNAASNPLYLDEGQRLTELQSNNSLSVEPEGTQRTTMKPRKKTDPTTRLNEAMLDSRCSPALYPQWVS